MQSRVRQKRSRLCAALDAPGKPCDNIRINGRGYDMTDDARIQEAMDAIKTGDLLVGQGKLDAALAVFQTGLELNRSLAADFPQQAVHWREQSVCQDRIGDTLMALDRPEEALAAYQISIRLSILLERADPADPAFGVDLAIGYNNAGNALLKLGRDAEAITQFEDGIAVRTRLVETHPEDASLRRQLMVNLIKLAQMGEGAAQLYRRAQEQALWLAAAGKLGPNEDGIPDLLGRKAVEAETAAPGDGRTDN